MKAIKNPYGWINKNDENQCGWALRYIREKNFYVHVDGNTIFPSLYLAFDAQAIRPVDNAEGREFIRKMKNAWSQKKYRKSNKNKTPCHFLIENKAKNHLIWLSKLLGKSQNETLEIILKGTFEHEKNVIAAKKNGADMPAMRQNAVILPSEVFKMTRVNSPTFLRYPYVYDRNNTSGNGP